MLISRKHGFLFVHIPKTGGSSIVTALTPHVTNRWKRETNRILQRFGYLGLAVQPYKAHCTASYIKSQLGEAQFESLYSFAFVRNPWDLQASIYSFLLKRTTDEGHEFVKRLGSFEAYIRWRCLDTHNKQTASEDFAWHMSVSKRQQSDYVYGLDGKQLVDFVGRFERLEEEFQKVCSQVGISVALPKTNVSKTRPYQEYYNAETRELVRRAFADDIHRFNYQFDRAEPAAA